MLGKLAGAAIILGSTTYAGWQVGARYARRPRELRDLQTGLAVLQTEVEYGATPLPEALRSSARSVSPTVAALFSETARRLEEGGGITPGEAMRSAIAAVSGDTTLAPADLEICEALAGVLGSSGRTDQIRHLQLACERLSAQEVRAAEDRARYERLARYAGLLVGGAIVLMLL